MVIHLPDQGGLFLDPTMRYFNTPDALPETSLGARALLLEGGRPRFVEMKEAPDTARKMSVARTVSTAPGTGDVQVNKSITFTPSHSALLRYAFSVTAEGEHLTAMESILRRNEPLLEIERGKIHDLEDPFAPLRIEPEGQTKGQVISGRRRFADGREILVFAAHRAGRVKQGAVHPLEATPVYPVGRVAGISN